MKTHACIRLFTMVELLTTIAVIIVLASMLLPALSRAKNLSKGIHCINNLKQLVAASLLYCDDNSGYVMKTNVATGRDWFAPIKNGGYIKYNGIYPKRTPPFHCMSNPLPTANHYLNCGWTNYAIGYWIAGAKLSKQKISVALFIDAYDPYQNKSNYYTLGGRGTEPWSYVFPVHEKSSNIGFSDGSARKLYIGERAISVNANSDLGDIKALWYWPIY